MPTSELSYIYIYALKGSAIIYNNILIIPFYIIIYNTEKKHHKGNQFYSALLDIDREIDIFTH
jgi:hypothetical protein